MDENLVTKRDNEYMRVLWLSLIAAETEEDLERLEATGVPDIVETIHAYREVVESDKFKEAVRLREAALAIQTDEKAQSGVQPAENG